MRGRVKAVREILFLLVRLRSKLSAMHVFADGTRHKRFVSWAVRAAVLI